MISDIYKKIHIKDTLSVLENKYSILGPMWINHQIQWFNGVYASFKDHEKFLMIIFLVKKTLDFYSKNFTKFSYDEFYSRDTIEIERYNIIEISTTLNIPKETTRRKLLELENDGAIKKYKKNIIIDKSKFYYFKPEDSIKRISRFLSVLSKLCVKEKVLSKIITTDALELIIKKNFSYIWKIYYELQISMMINFKKIFKDLDTFHIFATCVVNQQLYARKFSEDYMNRNNFTKIYLSDNMIQGINAMSISDITGIPRATVIRKLQKLIKLKSLTIDAKKHYKLSSDFTKMLLPLQKDTFNKLANFSAQIYNLVIISDNPNDKK